MTLSEFREARHILPHLGLQIGNTICLCMHDVICLYQHVLRRL